MGLHDGHVRFIPLHEILLWEDQGWTIYPIGGGHADYSLIAFLPFNYWQ